MQTSITHQMDGVRGKKRGNMEIYQSTYFL